VYLIERRMAPYLSGFESAMVHGFFPTAADVVNNEYSQLCKNIIEMPSVCQPGLDWISQNDIAEQASVLHGCHPRRFKFRFFFEFDWIRAFERGERSQLCSLDRRAVMLLIQRHALPLSAERDWQERPFYQLMFENYIDIVGDGQEDCNEEHRFARLSGDGIKSVSIDLHAIEKFDTVWHENGCLLSDRAFGLFNRYLRDDYFEAAQLI